MEKIEEFLRKRKEDGLLRALRPVSSRSEGRIFYNGKEYIDFSSNDYLGIFNHPKLIEAAKTALDKFGAANCASRLMSGDSELCHKLEERIAEFKGKESALFFNSGYQANTGIISSLYGNGDCIFADRLAHASIIDGIMLSQAKLFRFRHNDARHLESLLKEERHKFKNALIVTESVFSMDGDKAPLKEFAGLKERYCCEIFVDEAHATGIFGENGSGLVEEEQVTGKIDFIMGTFSKALAGYGAYLAASRKVTEYLINACRSFIYSTALPPAIVASNLASLDIIKDEPYRREKLIDSARYFRSALKNKGFTIPGDSQIIPVITGDNFSTQEFAERLREKGYWIFAVRPPTVPNGQARLRFSLTFNHGAGILEKLTDDIAGIRI